MRISLIAILASVSASALVPFVAKADERRTVRVIGNLTLSKADEEIFRTQLGARLRTFASDVQEEAERPRPVLFFAVGDDDELSEDVADTRAGKNNMIVVMFGGLLRGPENLMRPQARIYLGRSPARATLRYQQNRFVDVRARVPRGGSRQGEELHLYVLVIGYALLRREWLRRSELVGPIAAVLDRRIDDALRQGTVRSSPCLEWMRNGISEIRNPRLRPDPSARDPGDDEFSCVR
jgi:hypothetical protein